jgi:pyruvate kinase
MKNTKIIATIGPATNNEEKVIELYNAGINVIRFNFSHANYEEAGRNIELIKRLNKEGKTNLSLLLDTKGPEIRTGDLAEKNTYEAGEIFKVYVDPSKELTEKALFCDYPYLIEDIELGGYINIDSGLMNVEVLEKQEDCVVVKALNSAVI